MNKNKIFYGWVILIIATFALVVSNGLSIGGIPVFFKPIREEFVEIGAIEAGKAESFIAFGATLTFFLSGIGSPLAGWLITKFPIRLLMIAGCFLLGGGLIIHSQTASPELVYFSKILMGLSLGFVGVLANIVLVSNWFVRRRGLALGILLTGTSFGGVLIPQIANPLIATYGWRTAMLFISFIIWLILLPAIIFFVKTKPSDLGLFPDGDEQETVITETQNSSMNQSGMLLDEAIKTPVFWILAACAALIFYPIFVTSQQFILYLQTPKIGLTATQGATALSTLFAVSVAGKFLFGFLSDKISPAKVMLICCAGMFLSTLILFNITATTAFIFLAVFGLTYGGTFVLLQRIVADLFGNRDYAKILGVIIVVETFGAFIGGNITGKLADANGGDYTQAFYVVIVVTAIATGLVGLLNIFGQKKNIA